jgi:hypothetical protein
MPHQEVVLLLSQTSVNGVVKRQAAAAVANFHGQSRALHAQAKWLAIKSDPSYVAAMCAFKNSF